MNELIDCKKVISCDRVSIPSAIKKEWNVEEGDFITFSRNEHGQIVIGKVTA